MRGGGRPGRRAERMERIVLNPSASLDAAVPLAGLPPCPRPDAALTCAGSARDTRHAAQQLLAGRRLVLAVEGMPRSAVVSVRRAHGLDTAVPAARSPGASTRCSSTASPRPLNVLGAAPRDRARGAIAHGSAFRVVGHGPFEIRHRCGWARGRIPLTRRARRSAGVHRSTPVSLSPAAVLPLAPRRSGPGYAACSPAAHGIPGERAAYVCAAAGRGRPRRPGHGCAPTATVALARVARCGVRGRVPALVGLARWDTVAAWLARAPRRRAGIALCRGHRRERGDLRTDAQYRGARPDGGPYVANVWVDPDHRRRGVGTLLMVVAIEWSS